MTKEQAGRYGNALLKKMKGKGWKLRVWENLGWHYAVYNKGISLYTHYYNDGEVRYAGLPSPSYSFWCPENKSFKDPNRAVKYVVDYMGKWVRDLVEIYTDARLSIKEDK